MAPVRKSHFGRANVASHLRRSREQILTSLGATDEARLKSPARDAQA